MVASMAERTARGGSRSGEKSIFGACVAAASVFLVCVRLADAT